MTQSGFRVSLESLKGFVKELFVKVGMPSEDAETEAKVLVWANLRGVDSHGVQLIPWYVQAVDIGHMNPRPKIKILKETPATLLIDADHAFGPVVTTFVMKQVMEKARKVGIGWAYIRDTNHQGAMGYYALMAAEQGLAGISSVCSRPNTAPYGAKAVGVSNNPIAIAVPAKHHPPLILDMATSVAAQARLTLAKEKGDPIPEGWVLDEEGNPITDPTKAAIMLPFGGFKGSGLSLMTECLISLMVDNPKLEPHLGPDVKPFRIGPLAGNEERIRQHIQNSLVAAIDIGTFTDVETYKEHIDTLIDRLKALPKAKGFSEIFLPGEPEDRTAEDRLKNGIPLPENTVRNLKSIAEQFGIEFPKGM